MRILTYDGTVGVAYLKIERVWSPSPESEGLPKVKMWCGYTEVSHRSLPLNLNGGGTSSDPSGERTTREIYLVGP